jgi:snRNA-activating protein complex subunit 3
MMRITDGHRLPQEAAVFIRGPKNSDINTLTEIVSFFNLDFLPCTLSDRLLKKQAKNGSTPDPHSAVVMVSVYNRLTWSYNFVYRSSQHAVLSSNTLAELHNVIPCPSNELPDESTADGTFVGYESGPSKHPSGCIVVIEGTAYGDGLTENDYARYVFLLFNAVGSRCLLRLSSKLIAHIPEPLTIGSKMNETPFSSLSLRLNHPYWLVHHGNCEHFLVVDQIRYIFSLHNSDHLVDIFLSSLLHPDDPPSGYPLTTQITPPLLGNCRACSKVPAVYSIVGDMRLGESPCILCAPCWRNMGLPKDKEDEPIMVIPLLKYEFGW